MITLSDSLSVLSSIKNIHHPTGIAKNILQNIGYKAHLNNKHISFMWIPGHCNIDGNERSDKHS